MKKELVPEEIIYLLKDLVGLKDLPGLKDWWD